MNPRIEIIEFDRHSNSTNKNHINIQETFSFNYEVLEIISKPVQVEVDHKGLITTF